MKIHYSSPCSLLMLIILFLTYTRDQAATIPRFLEAEELPYSLIDIERLQVDNFNTSLQLDLPTYTSPFTNSSFSKQLTFYARFCFLNRQRHDPESIVTVFALKYSALYNGSNYNCSLYLQFGTNLTFVEECRNRNGSNLTNDQTSWSELHQDLVQLFLAETGDSQVFSLFIKTNPVSIEACVRGIKHILPLLGYDNNNNNNNNNNNSNSSNISLQSPDIILLDPESTSPPFLCAISWTLIDGGDWQHSCLNDNYTNCCLIQQGKYYYTITNN